MLVVGGTPDTRLTAEVEVECQALANGFCLLWAVHLCFALDLLTSVEMGGGGGAGGEEGGAWAVVERMARSSESRVMFLLIMLSTSRSACPVRRIPRAIAQRGELQECCSTRTPKLRVRGWSFNKIKANTTG